MGNLHLVTGYQGHEHVTAADHGSLYAAIFGNGNYVLDRGNKLAASVITNNQIRIADGDIVLQGRHIRLNEGSSVDLTIENGAQGYKRNDLIVARYTRNPSTGIEEASLVAIKGTAVTSSPTDPAYNDGDILTEHAETADFPLYRVPLDGITIGTLEQLFDVGCLVTLGSDKKVPAEYLPSMNYIPTSQKGAKNGVASLDSSGKVPSGQLPSMNYIPTSQKGTASGVATLDASGRVPTSQLPSMNETNVTVYDSAFNGVASATEETVVNSQEAVVTQIGKFAHVNFRVEVTKSSESQTVSLYSKFTLPTPAKMISKFCCACVISDDAGDNVGSCVWYGKSTGVQVVFDKQGNATFSANKKAYISGSFGYVTT